MPYRRTGRPTGRPPYPGPLTPAEERVLDLVREDLTDAEIAERLGLSRDTVHTHVNHMLAKLDLHDRRDLAARQPEAAPAEPRRAFVPAFFHRLAASKPVAIASGAALVGVIAMVAVTLAVISRGATTENLAPTPGVVLTTTPTPTSATSATPVSSPVPAITPMPPNVIATVVASLPPPSAEPRLTFAGPMSFVTPDEGWFLHREQVMHTTDGGRHWRQVGTLPDTTHTWPFDFADDRTGWASRGGDLQRTTDGGATWHQVAPNVEGPVDALDFADESHGWTLRGKRLLSSSDGGETWARVENPCNSAALLSRVTEDLGFAACTTAPVSANPGTGIFVELWTTSDGGAAWSMVGTTADDPPPGVAHIPYHGYVDSIWFGDNTGGLIAADSALYSTSDGGRTWALERDAPPETLFFGAREFSDGSLLLFSYTMEPGVTLRERDGRWRHQYPPSPLYDVTATGAASLVALDQSLDRPVLVQSNDGGETWTEVGPVPGDVVRELDFAGPDNGWLIAYALHPRTDFELWRTADGGEPWSRGAAFPTAETPPAVSLVSPTEGFAATSKGLLLASSDGGLTFTEVATTSRDTHCMATTTEGWRVRHARGGDILDATSDGGLTWTAIALFEDIRRILSLPGDVGWVETAERGTLYGTSDGGRTWTRLSLPSLYAYGPFTAVDREQIWITDDAQRLLRSTDGGVTWRVERAP